MADIGAAGGIHERWSELGAGLKVMGFEPDQRAFAGLIKNEQMVWINAALADYEGDATLLVTRHQTNTSLLKPNRLVIDSIYQNPSDFDVVKEVTVPCTTLDKASLQSGLAPTAIKIDTQGTELSILKGALNCLKNSLLVIELEVEFVELYQHQPLFGEIDSFLRDQGFVLFDLGNLLMLKRGSYGFSQERKGQIIAADALYFRTPDNLAKLLDSLNGESAINLIAQYCGVCSLYGYRNLALEALQLLHQKNLISKKVFEDFCNAISFSGAAGKDVFWPGQGRLHAWLKRWVNKLEPRQNSIWINDIGNE
ncbi:FkbM family methyltransferase [Polynucleobacter sp. MWH-Braz-FAM2G]|uniref:FkbM family methyltransferase n=1 Tax=Polynucleobacter sp. MWH-Braz-FAM2G TaxID=1855883 RepID=UPI001BFE3C18|nr:FkbM family methyltransferase [Polynucleobacter sp. MWH-Braz-FAM2G]